MDDVFDIQDDISEKISIKLLATLTTADKLKIKTNRPSNTEAYEYYLKGQYFHSRFTGSSSRDEFLKAEQMLKKSIEVDPNYANSFAELADLYHTYAGFLAKTREEKKEYIGLLEKYINIAFKLDSTSAEVQFVKGLDYWEKRQLDKTLQCFMNAIKIDRNVDKAYWHIGNFMWQRGLPRIALHFYNLAIDINPLNPLRPFYYALRGQCYYESGAYDKVEYELNHALQLDANYKPAQVRLLDFLISMRRIEEAESLIEKYKNLSPDLNLDPFYALLYATKGDKEKAFESWKHRTENIYALLGMKEEAIQVLSDFSERCIKRETSLYKYLKNDLTLENIRSDPRFQEILGKHKQLYEENLRKYGDIEL